MVTGQLVTGQQVITQMSISQSVTSHWSSSHQSLDLEIQTPGEPASVAQLDARPTGDQGFDPRRGRQHSFVEIDHEIYGHSLPSADSRRAVVSFWQKNVHNTG